MAVQNISKYFQSKKIKPPKRYNVIMLNDHYTTQDFVMNVLMDIFRKSNEDAANLMLKIHNEGKAVVGQYSLDIARTKTSQVYKLAQEQGFPLRCDLQEV